MKVKIEAYLASYKHTIYPDGTFENEYYVYIKNPRLFMFRLVVPPENFNADYLKNKLKNILSIIGNSAIFINRYSSLEDFAIKYPFSTGLALFCFLFKPQLWEIEEKNEDSWEMGTDLWDTYSREEFFEDLGEIAEISDKFICNLSSKKNCLEFCFSEKDLED